MEGWMNGMIGWMNECFRIISSIVRVDTSDNNVPNDDPHNTKTFSSFNMVLPFRHLKPVDLLTDGLEIALLGLVGQ